MTYSLYLTSYDHTVVVDLTAMNPNFTFDYNNPLIKIPTPWEDMPDDPTKKWNVVTLNINMSSQTVLLDFTEMSGLGNLGSAVNFDAPVTVFEKMLYLCRQRDEYKKQLWVNDAKFGDVEIEGYRVSIPAGRKDLVQHSVTLVLILNMYGDAV
jgi:hypothetical protein